MEYVREDYVEKVTKTRDVIYVTVDEFHALINIHRAYLLSQGVMNASTYDNQWADRKKQGIEPKFIMKLTDPYSSYSVESEVIINWQQDAEGDE